MAKGTLVVEVVVTKSNARHVRSPLLYPTERIDPIVKIARFFAGPRVKIYDARLKTGTAKISLKAQHLSRQQCSGHLAGGMVVARLGGNQAL